MRISQRPPARGVYILPNLFTTASLLTGFLSMIFAMSSQYEHAAVAILCSALMDGLDGKVARLTRSSSKFGIEYDSLADVVAFGVAPGILLWSWQLWNFDRLGIAVAFLNVACVALRLARFNVAVPGTSSKRFFIGLPSPAGGCTLATFALFAPLLPQAVQAARV